jgi:hypothetical protein
MNLESDYVSWDEYRALKAALEAKDAEIERLKELYRTWHDLAQTHQSDGQAFFLRAEAAEAALKETQSRLIRGRLSAFYEKHEIAEWMNNPHPQLGGKSADEMIAAGKAVEVEQVISRLEDGVYL